MSGILAPIEIGGVALKNRVFLPGHTTNFGLNNLPTDRNNQYLATRARGGVGLIISEAIRVHPTSAGRHLTLGAFDETCIPSYEKMTEAVHENGAAIFAQIMHAGRQANGDATHSAAWGASTIPWVRGGQTPHMMSQADIAGMVKIFAGAASMMRQANFDGLEIHLGHGHLIQQFLSPASNNRTDKYGGSQENRMRFAVEILRAVFAAVPGMPVGIRISADEFLPEGLQPKDMVEIVDLLHSEFDLSYLHVSHSAYHGSYSVATQIADMSFSHAPFREHASIFKKAFPDLPILAVCRLDSMKEAAELIDSGEADMVGLARPHIADPELVNKYAAGQSSQTRSCIACNQECIGKIEKNLPISCVVNPEVGMEKRWIEIRSKKGAPKKVLVIGGGPAGMSAALSAHQLGHQVTIMEASDSLGGQVAIAATLRRRSRIGLLTQELEKRVHDSTIIVALNTFVVSLENHLPEYDKIIIAAGATHSKREYELSIPVLSAIEAIEKYRDVVTDKKESIIIIDEEGTWVAGSVAEQLAENGFQVHFISPTSSLCATITMYSRLALIPRLKNLGVKFYLSSELASNGTIPIIRSSINELVAEVSDCVAVVDCAPKRSNDALYQEAPLAHTDQIALVGDALSPRSVAEATFEGNAIGAFLDLDLALRVLEH
jgi:2,4-dienoyl-CoA reductase-like NADH-dependent reductase (Old Yellow Enzyme family)